MMAERSRFQNSLFNLASGFAYRFLIMLTAFVVRTVFIHYLSEDYLGINGLYSSILSMLSLAELGFGSAMVYSMYQPLAQKDDHKLAQLMQLYRKVYRIVGTVILALGLALVPFLDYLIKNKPDIPGLTLYYLLFLGDTVLSYWFFAYRNSILQADQKAYIITNCQTVFNIIKSAVQIVMLVCFHNYLVYLLVQILCTVGQNVALALKVKKSYPVFGREPVEKLPREDCHRIFKDVKALMMSKIAHMILNSSDSIIISAFVGINWTGYLSNFSMIVEAVAGVLTQITAAITASLGNFFAKEERNAGYQLFKRVDFLNFWLYGFSSVALIVLLNPFITIWVGTRFTLSTAIVVTLVLRFFTSGMINTLWTFRSTLGLFVQGQYRSLVVAALNVILSIGLSFCWGVAGVLAATTISRLMVNLWFDPLVLHKHGFQKPVGPYLKRWLLRVLLLCCMTVGMMLLSQLVFSTGVTLGSFVLMTLLTAVLPNLLLWLLFHKTDEFQYFYGLFREKVLERCKKTEKSGG